MAFKRSGMIMMMLLLLGGCSLMPNKADEKKQAEASAYIPVQDYTGQGYSFDNGEETGEFAKQHRNEIIEKVKQYFKQKYHLDITVHQIYGATDAAVVFAESKKDPKFHTSVIVGIDLENKKIGDVGAYEGSVEGAITTGLYVMAYEKEFQKLDDFCTAITKEYPVIGRTKEAVDNTVDSGYATPYYYLNTTHLEFLNSYKSFLNNPKINGQSLKKLIEDQKFISDNMIIEMTFYMRKKHENPDRTPVDKIKDELKKQKDFPPGEYSISVNSNDILMRTGTEKEYKDSDKEHNEVIIEPNGEVAK
ncbi:DUF1672 family protein [Heyndrickxia coagulans]|nr:DUF1672 family protein [Heyndrickxia coagulans]MCR2846409.1 DUF1672 domain-containing protein [Heyndrickxia coagulans]MDR4224067.1 DUF1672 family protein [Heyndrickxia coagulans DSM 1 = ATCC 7050]MED4494794.1 DUF1672 family protein [Heyndrickxia coagulans]MED4537564.1 DUF1672 family protein [Heyndrickxia coagulans]QJE31476.1 DUF1672 family protein [Heyndrickxia coagulans]